MKQSRGSNGYKFLQVDDNQLRVKRGDWKTIELSHELKCDNEPSSGNRIDCGGPLKSCNETITIIVGWLFVSEHVGSYHA